MRNEVKLSLRSGFDTTTACHWATSILSHSRHILLHYGIKFHVTSLRCRSRRLKMAISELQALMTPQPRSVFQRQIYLDKTCSGVPAARPAQTSKLHACGSAAHCLWEHGLMPAVALLSLGVVCTQRSSPNSWSAQSSNDQPEHEE